MEIAKLVKGHAVVSFSGVDVHIVCMYIPQFAISDTGVCFLAVYYDEGVFCIPMDGITFHAHRSVGVIGTSRKRIEKE